MGRDRQFSDLEVMSQVAQVFSTRGYGGTSLSMLCEATGLGKQSLYNSFGDKRALYLKALDCATDRWEAVHRSMAVAPHGREALQRFFEALLRECGSGDPARQCCVVSSGLLEGVDDELIRATLRSKWGGTHELLRAAVERGQRDGSIRNTRPSAVLADLLMAAMAGLRVSAQTGMALARLQMLAKHP